ncbi:MAG: hypothetical protein U9R36_02900, partial [Elusimicrobiota bacterium]|nr:hypothetical protein [Elusimicrobiota bacterium]
MDLSWNENTELDISRYWVYRATGASTAPTSTATAVHITTRTASENFYQDNNVPDLNKYYSYWVVAVDTFNRTSAFSARQSAAPDTEGPEIIPRVLKLPQRALGRDKILVEYDVMDNLKIISTTVTYKGIGDTVEYSTAVIPSFEPTELSVSLEIDKANINKDGFEYYISASDGVNISLYPDADNNIFTIEWIKVAAPTDVPGQKFLTPSNPEVVFGKDVVDVVITDVRGNEVFSKSRGSSKFIIWN